MEVNLESIKLNSHVDTIGSLAEIESIFEDYDQHIKLINENLMNLSIMLVLLIEDVNASS